MQHSCGPRMHVAQPSHTHCHKCLIPLLLGESGPKDLTEALPDDGVKLPPQVLVWQGLVLRSEYITFGIARKDLRMAYSACGSLSRGSLTAIS